MSAWFNHTQGKWTAIRITANNIKGIQQPNTSNVLEENKHFTAKFIGQVIVLGAKITSGKILKMLHEGQSV